MDFLPMLKRVGFEDAKMVGETGFKRSPLTKGAFFYAAKQAITSKEKAGQA
jgi:hypothetical protein